MFSRGLKQMEGLQLCPATDFHARTRAPRALVGATWPRWCVSCEGFGAVAFPLGVRRETKLHGGWGGGGRGLHELWCILPRDVRTLTFFAN